jgi:hypothetical protein
VANLIILSSKNGGKNPQKISWFSLFLKKNRQNAKIRPIKNAAGVLPIMQEGTHGLLHIVSNFATSACLVVTVAINFAFFFLSVLHLAVLPLGLVWLELTGIVVWHR